MNYTIEKENVYKFINKYFNFLKLKIFICFEIISIFHIIYDQISNVLFHGIISLCANILFGILIGTMLKSETKKHIKKFYDDNKVTNSIKIVCNLKKVLGPVMGILYINNNEIKFVPFRENNKRDGFCISKKDISMSYKKGKFYNNLLFGEIFEYIKVSTYDKSILFQCPKVKFSVEKANTIFTV